MAEHTYYTSYENLWPMVNSIAVCRTIASLKFGSDLLDGLKTLAQDHPHLFEMLVGNAGGFLDQIEAAVTKEAKASDKSAPPGQVVYIDP